MIKVHPIIAGSNAPLELTFLDAASDQAVNLTGCTGFSAIAENTETGSAVSMESVIATNAAQGKIKVEWVANAFTPGLFSLQITCTDATGHAVVLPSEAGQLLIRVGNRNAV